MIEGSGEQAVISTRGAREGLTEKVHLSTDIKEIGSQICSCLGEGCSRPWHSRCSAKALKQLCAWCLPGAARTVCGCTE